MRIKKRKRKKEKKGKERKKEKEEVSVMKPKNFCNSYKIPPQGAEGEERDGGVYDEQDDGTEHEPGAEDFVEHEVAAQPASAASG